MTKHTPEEVADKYVRNAQNALGDWVAGVQAVTEAPGMKAAAKKQKWLAGINRAANEGTWEQNVAAVSLQEWVATTVGKGEGRYGSGVASARNKQVEFHNQLQSFREPLDRKIANMSDLTPQDRENKMLENMRGMRNFRFRRRG